MTNDKIQIFPTTSELLDELATQLAQVAEDAINARGSFSFVLSGGSTPKALYQLLASEAWKGRFDWSKIKIFFGDDRAVAPDDALSNYHMASEALLSHVPAQVFRIETESTSLEEAATAYEAQIRAAGEALDVVLLGLGEDGHTASLFPHSPQLNENEKWVVATPVASLEPYVRRITLTFPAINEARHIWFLVTGAGKADRLNEVLNTPADVQRLPSQGVKATTGQLTWFLDEAAAAQLK